MSKSKMLLIYFALLIFPTKSIIVCDGISIVHSSGYLDDSHSSCSCDDKYIWRASTHKCVLDCNNK